MKGTHRPVGRREQRKSLLFSLPERIVCLGQIGRRLGEAWFETHRFLEMSYGFRQPAQGLQSNAQVVVRFGGAGFILERHLILPGSLLEATHAVQENPEVVIGRGVIGLKPLRLLEAVCRLFSAAHAQQGVPQIVMKPGRSRFDFQGSAVLCYCLFRPAE